MLLLWIGAMVSNAWGVILSLRFSEKMSAGFVICYSLFKCSKNGFHPSYTELIGVYGCVINTQTVMPGAQGCLVRVYSILDVSSSLRSLVVCPGRWLELLLCMSLS